MFAALIRRYRHVSKDWKVARQVLPWAPPLFISFLYVGGYAYYAAFLRPFIGTVALEVAIIVIWLLGVSSFVRLVLFTRSPGSLHDFLSHASRHQLRWQHVLIDNESEKMTPFIGQADVSRAESDVGFGATPSKSRAVLWTCTPLDTNSKSKVGSARTAAKPSPSLKVFKERSGDGGGNDDGGGVATTDTTRAALVFVSHDMDSTDAPRMCKQCNAPKLDRSCHSSGHGRCLLKFDHHCLFLNTPIGHSNYKYFVIFLVYTTVISSMASIATAITPQAPYRIATTLFISGISSLVLALLGQHIRQISSGATTMEEIKYEKSVEAYDYGLALNFQSVFGRFKYWFMWPLPVNSTPGLGICWPHKDDIEKYWDWCEAQQVRTWYGAKNTSNVDARLVLAF